MTRSARKVARTLATLAHERGGYFAAKQARQVGYVYRHLDYHASAGDFERVGHGLYRLPEFPRTDHDDLIRLSLWSRNQRDDPQAVASHDTARVLHELQSRTDERPARRLAFPGRGGAGRDCVRHHTDCRPAGDPMRRGRVRDGPSGGVIAGRGEGVRGGIAS